MLTVCIPYRDPADRRFYDRLIQELHYYSTGFPVEFMSLPNDGRRTIGKYRQQLLDNVQTPYVAFIDSDDKVGRNYFTHVFDGIKQGAKVIGLRGIITTEGRNPFTFEHSVRHDRWYDRRKKGTIEYFRPPNHLNPIQTKIAQQIGYNSLRHGEDLDYSMRLQRSGLLTLADEYMVDEPIYYYLYRPKK